MKIIFKDRDASVEWDIPVSIRSVIKHDMSKETLIDTVNHIDAVAESIREYLNKPQKFTQYPGQLMPDPIRAIVALLCDKSSGGDININSILDSED